MEKERKVKIITVIVLIIVVIGLSIAFASLSSLLTINGAVDVENQDFHVKFQNISNVTENGASFVQQPTIAPDDTSIIDYSVNLIKPGGMAEFSWEIYNDGQTNVKPYEIIPPDVICTSDTGNEQDEEQICGNKKVEILTDDNYTDYGVRVSTNSLSVLYTCGYNAHIEEDTNIFFASSIKPGDKATCAGVITFKNEVTELPSSNVTISGLGFKMKFINS